MNSAMFHETRLEVGRLAYGEPTPTHVYDLQLSKRTLVSVREPVAVFLWQCFVYQLGTGGFCFAVIMS